jgi:hypothetical protein
MDQLNDLIAEATARIAPNFFNLPIDGSGPIYRERVYCYELYHQLRCLWPEDTDFVLNGEIDKRGHPIIRRLGADLSVPDFLIHVPGYMARNHAILEVKPSDNATPRGIEKDLRTLSTFQAVVGYERGLYLFYGNYPQQLVRGVAERVELDSPIEVWIHREPGAAAEQVDLFGPETLGSD